MVVIFGTTQQFGEEHGRHVAARLQIDNRCPLSDQGQHYLSTTNPVEPRRQYPVPYTFEVQVMKSPR
jgi:hypothetical protein